MRNFKNTRYKLPKNFLRKNSDEIKIIFCKKFNSKIVKE